MRNGDFEHYLKDGKKLKISSKIYAPLQSMCTLQREEEEELRISEIIYPLDIRVVIDRDS